MNKIKTALVLVILVAAGITCINPNYPKQIFLQHIGTLLLLIPLVYDAIKNRMPMSAFVAMTLFALLHVVGANWIYSYVPYREWSISHGVPADYWGVPVGFQGDVKAFFEEHCKVYRNHYDRLVHFSFGFLLFPYLVHKCRRWVEGKPMIAIVMAWLLVQAGSMIYEIFEWQLSVRSKQGDAYNGQQGDIWDAQKDMMLAMVGSTLMAMFYVIKNKYRKLRR